MKFKNVAKFFDRIIARDAYNPRFKIKCQLEPSDLFKVEGSRLRVRNMTTAPEVNIPPRRTIKLEDQVYLVSEHSRDYWDGEALRDRYVIQGADSYVLIRTIAEELADLGGTQAWASIDFNKYGTDERDSSEFHDQYSVFFSGAESAPEDSVLSVGGDYYLVRNSYRTPSGLINALSNRLDDPVVGVEVVADRVYDPITDTYSGGSQTVRGLQVRWQEHFEYLSQGSTKYVRGDGMLLLPSSVSAKAGSTVTIRSEVWSVISALTHADYHSLHIRRA